MKGFVKDHAQRTHRCPDKFAEQCALCKYENNILDYHVMDDMTKQMGLTRRTHTKHLHNTDEFKEEYTLLLSMTNHGGVGTSSDRPDHL